MDFAVDGVEGLFETRFGFVVDLGDGFFQKGDGGLRLRFGCGSSVAFARFFELLQGGEVDGAEGFDLLGGLPMLLFNTFGDSFANASSASKSAAFGQVLMVAFGVNQGFLLLQQGGFGGPKLQQLFRVCTRAYCSLPCS